MKMLSVGMYKARECGTKTLRGKPNARCEDASMFFPCQMLCYSLPALWLGGISYIHNVILFTIKCWEHNFSAYFATSIGVTCIS